MRSGLVWLGWVWYGKARYGKVWVVNRSYIKIRLHHLRVFKLYSIGYLIGFLSVVWYGTVQWCMVWFGGVRCGPVRYG